MDAFHNLVQEINDILGPSNGIDSDGVDVDELKKVMLDYRSVEDEWSKYAFADHSRAYTRNLVDRGNGKANLVSRCLRISYTSAILHFIEALLLAVLSSKSFRKFHRDTFSTCISTHRPPQPTPKLSNYHTSIKK